jgi:hypothetical protein
MFNVQCSTFNVFEFVPFQHFSISPSQHFPFHFAELLRLFADCVHVGIWRDSGANDTTNVPFLFAGLPAFGIETSGITRSDVCAYVSTCYIPASYRLGGTEHVWGTNSGSG